MICQSIVRFRNSKPIINVFYSHLLNNDRIVAAVVGEEDVEPEHSNSVELVDGGYKFRVNSNSYATKTTLPPNPTVSMVTVRTVLLA